MKRIFCHGLSCFVALLFSFVFSFASPTGSISGGKEVGYVDGWIDLDELIRLGEPA